MAERPVFVPVFEGCLLVSEVPVQFVWHPGMAASQKMKNVTALHEAAADRSGLVHLLEVSTKSSREIGRKLSAFHLKITSNGRSIGLENAFQGSKVFEDGGPYTDLFDGTPGEAKRDDRLRNSGRLTGFVWEGTEFPLSPPTLFYDWLYAQAIFSEREWLRRLEKMDGFTDIEFNPTKSINCQARALAAFVALEKRGRLDKAMMSFESFAEQQSAAIA